MQRCLQNAPRHAFPLLPVVKICRGQCPHERNIRILNRFWFSIDLLRIKRRFHSVILGIVLTTNVFVPEAVLAQILEEVPSAEVESNENEEDVLSNTVDLLSGRVFIDHNGDTVNDETEPGLAKVGVTLALDGEIIATAGHMHFPM